jgi:hypothetical protein
MSALTESLRAGGLVHRDPEDSGNGNSRNSQNSQRPRPNRQQRKRKAEYVRILQAELERVKAVDTDASSDDGK